MPYFAASIIPLRVLVTDTTGAPANAGSLTFTVTEPDNTSWTSTAITPSPTGTYDLDYDVAVRAARQVGVYAWKAVATGANAGEFDGQFVVLSTPTNTPVWMPALDQVADLIPLRTLTFLTPGTETYLGTFTTDTTPTAEQATRLVSQACAFVMAEVGITVSPTVYDEARGTAAILAAALIEAAYPERQPGTNGYDRLKTLADQRIATLKDNNLAATGIPVDQAQVLSPYWQMPDPVPWGDRLNY